MSKYSILLPYLNRDYQLFKTLSSFVTQYNRNDFEVVIIEDSKNEDSPGLVGIIREFRRWMSIIHVKHLGENTNPAPLYNLGAENSFGDYLILSSPECYHQTNILRGLDQEFEKNSDAYIACACKSMDINDVAVSWFQHSILRNCLYHFCSAISADQYKKIGGFDEEFSTGYCFDDDDFKATVINNGIDIVTRDDLIVCHQFHTKTYNRNRKLWLRNKELFESKHGPYNPPVPPPRIQNEKEK